MVIRKDVERTDAGWLRAYSPGGQLQICRHCLSDRDYIGAFLEYEDVCLLSLDFSGYVWMLTHDKKYVGCCVCFYVPSQ